MFNTYKFYNNEYKRLAIFAEPINSSEMEVITIPCNKLDFFSKKTAWELYHKVKKGEKVNHTKEVIKATDQDDFLRHCRRNYYQMRKLHIETKDFKNIKVRKVLKSQTVIMSALYKSN